MILTFGSLFAGIGGIDLGLERAGMVCKFQVEIDDYCNRVLAKHWPTVPRFRDVREVGCSNLPYVDVLAGGFPCQDISQAGYKAGLSGTRSGLWHEFARLIGELRPEYVLVENVAALLHRGIDTVLGDLAALQYDADAAPLPACALGAPHTRERLFIVAHAHCQLGETRFRPFPHGQTAHERRCDSTGTQHWIQAFSGVRGVAHGIPTEVDRIRALGNAVVPQCAEYIGRLIVAHAEGEPM